MFESNLDLMTLVINNYNFLFSKFIKHFSYIFSLSTMPRRKAALHNGDSEPLKKRKKLQQKEDVTNGNKLKKIENLENSSNHQSDNNVVETNMKTKDGRLTNLKIISWNVAGVRAWVKKEGHKWLFEQNADMICLQEVKCEKKEIPAILKDKNDYSMFWNAAKIKKGFSGVALFSKTTPLNVTYGINVEEHDNEGRAITAEYDKFFLVTTYVPNSQRGLKRLPYRMKWNNDFKSYLKSLELKKPVILCGDMNVSHLDIDLANPKQNKKSAGFTQEERDGMSDLLESGFVDTFRYLYPEVTNMYTFWTYMGNARLRNVGWRLDYFIVSKCWIENLCDNVMATKVMGSDHCPIVLYFALPCR